jgi:dolichyl-phosphate-mannose--protein O-mannosyl transferase
MVKERFIGYAPIAAILTFALSLRVWRLQSPSGYIFDEVYYAKNAASLITSFVELDEQGASEFVVHPPLGKWLIGFGIKIFGNNEFGWRISAAVFGTLSVLLIYLISEKLFNSKFLSLTAAALISFDGLNLVMSRVALLDIFLVVFILLSFYLLILNKYLASAVAIGMAVATKWSGGFILLLMLIFVIFEHRDNLRKVIKLFFNYTLIPLLAYLSSWGGWLLTSTGWARQSGSSVFGSFWSNHIQILNFHRDLTQTHSYQANPWSWLILGRPTSFFYDDKASCGQVKCAQEILAIGTPFLWWSAIFAIATVLGFFISKTDRKAGLILLGFAGTYLPWFAFQDRPLFYFYSISILPFLVLAIIYCFNLILNQRHAHKYITLYTVLIGLNFLYFLPLFTGIPIPYSDWLERMWLNSWI